MPAMLFHEIVFHLNLKSAGIFFVASPIISKLRVTARFRVSSIIKSSSDNSLHDSKMNRHSSEMCWRYSLGSLDVLNLTQDAWTDVRT